MILSIDSESGIIRIGDPPQQLPGILESLRVSGSLIMNDASIQGRSGTTKIAQGWEDAAVSIALSLIDDLGTGKTRFDFLKEITAIFKTLSKQGGPEVFTLSHPMLSSWQAHQMLFSRLESSESRTRRIIAVSLDFEEYGGAIAAAQARKTNKSTTGSTSGPVVPEVSKGKRAGLGSLEKRYGEM